MAGACSGCHSSHLSETRCSQAFHVDIETPNRKGEEQRHILTPAEEPKIVQWFQATSLVCAKITSGRFGSIMSSMHDMNSQALYPKKYTNYFFRTKDDQMRFSSFHHPLAIGHSWPQDVRVGPAPARSLSWAPRSLWHSYWESSRGTWETRVRWTGGARLLIGHRD